MKKYLLFTIVFLALSPINMAFAENGYPIGTGGAGIPQPTTLPATQDGNYTTEQINKYIYYVVGALVTLSAAFAVFFIFQGGVQYTISMGGDEGLGKAKKTLMWAVLGLLLVIVSYQIVVTIITMTFDAPAG